jgi:hypothetical protein
MRSERATLTTPEGRAACAQGEGGMAQSVAPVAEHRTHRERGRGRLAGGRAPRRAAP